MVDPDTNQRWAEDGERRRAECHQRGGHTFGDANVCHHCRHPRPDADRPRVTLIAGKFRAVHNSKAGTLTIEQRSQDAVGGERWDAIKTLSSTQSRSEESVWPLFVLLSEGKAP